MIGLERVLHAQEEAKTQDCEHKSSLFGTDSSCYRRSFTADLPPQPTQPPRFSKTAARGRPFCWRPFVDYRGFHR
jgi:hypothetical protein